MRLRIPNKGDYRKEFIYISLPKYIHDEVINRLDSKRLQILDEYFKFNSLDVITKAVSNLVTTEDTTSYFIDIDKTIKIGDRYLTNLIAMITFGNLGGAKNYTVIYDVFKEVKENILELYDRWVEEGSL